ncbi:MAG: hypothetical protein QN135_08855 [Armatimonadota bacterium]|nr:hypothetical protein [Armatimonadota bacterium]
MRTHRTLLIGTAGTALALLLGIQLIPAPLAQLEASPSGFARYPYGGATLNGWIAESYAETGAGDLPAFTSWLEDTYWADSSVHWKGVADLTEALRRIRADLQRTAGVDQRSALEREAAAWLHRVTKRLIPRFSIERGYEFAYTVRYGERQCFLQSVLLAALLQGAGIEAGTYMVWRNDKGQTTNNGHATAFARLSNGRDILVDASYPEPFVRHQGVFVRHGDTYRFAEPLYAADGTITGYRASRRAIPLGTIQGLDEAFLRSQFYFYRGEHAPGGWLAKPSTPQGLARSATHMEQAQRLNPGNPLAVYVLGHVYRKQNRIADAKEQYRRAHRLYDSYGYVPAGPADAYRWATR